MDFWVVIKKDVGFVGLNLPDRTTGGLSNVYLDDSKYEPLVGKTYSELSKMYPLNKKFKNTQLHHYFNNNFLLLERRESGVLNVYKYRKLN